MDLIKRQRAKFTVITTVISAIFLLIMLGGFFVLSYASNDVGIRNSLDKALASPNDYNTSAPQALRCFFVFVDKDGNHNVKEDLSYYGSSRDDIIAKGIEIGEGTYKTGGRYFICAEKSVEGGRLIAIMDRTEYRELLVNTGIQVILLYVLSVSLAALLAFLSSARLLLPVADSFNKQRDLIANASHELKTPLTVISANINVIKSEPESTVESNAEWMQSIEAQIERMNELIKNMLELSKIEQSELPKEELNLSTVAQGACLTFEPICFEKKVNLITQIQPDITAFGDKGALDRLIVILLDNAIKYCNPDGKVGLRLTADQKRIRLSVMNTGEAISKEEAKHVFDRFYRTDGARKNEDKQSFGLGLSIAAATVSAHGGEITCKGVEGKGTIFTVTLPNYKKKPKPRNNKN